MLPSLARLTGWYEKLADPPGQEAAARRLLAVLDQHRDAFLKSGFLTDEEWGNEKAGAFERLGREFGLTQEQMAQRTGKDRSSVSNFLRLLKHPKSTAPDRAFQLDPPFERIVRAIYGPVDEHGARLVHRGNRRHADDRHVEPHVLFRLGYFDDACPSSRQVSGARNHDVGAFHGLDGHHG